MSWHLSLLRKYSSYNHSRILNQLKTELKTKPIERRKTQSIENSQSKGIESRNQQTAIHQASDLSANRTKSITITPAETINNESASKSTSAEVGSTVTFNNTNMTAQKNNFDTGRSPLLEDNQQTFKERLKTIDMR